ncbi:MAG: DUF2892 domain-containing protein [Hyphomicrobiales bacterium]
MGANVGTADRITRIIIGVLLIGYALYGSSNYAYLGWIGILPIGTALFRWCPAYTLLGLNTGSKKKT